MPVLRTALALTAACLIAAPASAGAVETVVQDDALLLHGDDAAVTQAMQRIRTLGFDRVRLTADWSVIAPSPTATLRPLFDAEDPAAYPDGAWVHLDRAVRAATAAGLRPMVDIGFWAPRWATSEPEATDRPRREVQAGEFGRFAAAVARRYSGTWSEPSDPVSAPARPLLEQLLGRPAAEPKAPEKAEPLPAVDLFTLWNEPNHQGFLEPQWQQEPDGRWIARSADIYRELVHAGYGAVKAAAPSARVLVGGTASMGSSVPGRSGVPPLRFLRRLACVDDQFQPDTSGACASFRQVPGDGWAHHPYSLRTTPDVVPVDPDKAPVGATGRLTSTLARLVAAGRLAPGTADVYMTEYGYETRPQDPHAPFTEDEQPALLAWAESIATADPAVRMWAQFQLDDRPELPTADRRWSDWQSGLFDASGRRKPAAARWRHPVHARCVAGRRWVELWAAARGMESGALASVEERYGGRWRPIASASRRTRGALRRRLRARRGAAYRVRWSAGSVRARSARVMPRC